MESTGTVTFATARGPASGYLARSAASRAGGGRPAVVVIQEWWGLVPHIEDMARRIAGEGYIALAPDIYHGASTVDAEEADRLELSLDVFAAEPPDAANPLRTHPAVIATPHSASVTREGRRRMEEMAMDRLLAFFAGARPADIVNPAAWRAS